MTRPTGTTRRASRLGVGLIAAALVTLSACGSDDDGDDSATATSNSSASSPSETAGGASGGSATQSGQQTQTLDVSAVDFGFELASTDLPAGEYTIDLTNDGSATHDLVVERDGEDVAEIEDVGPGRSSSATVTLEPGEYVFYCSIGNHRAMGMEVTVTVT